MIAKLRIALVVCAVACVANMTAMMLASDSSWMALHGSLMTAFVFGVRYLAERLDPRAVAAERQRIDEGLR